MAAHSVHVDSGTNEGYEENILEDLQDVIDALPLGDMSVKLSSWSVEQLSEMGSWLEPFMSAPVIDANDLWKLSVKLGKVARKLDLTGNSNFGGVMRHLYGTVVLAHHLASTGAIVHLIEGVSGEGHQLVGDADLAYSDQHGSYHVDYTNMSSLGDLQILLLPDHGQFREKYRKLRINLIEGFEPRVMTAGIHSSCFAGKISVPLYRNCPREADFASADKLIDLVRLSTWTDANTCLEAYANMVRVWSGSSEQMIDSPKLHVSESITHSFIKTSGRNGVLSARIHKDFLSSLEVSLILNEEARPRTLRFFSPSTVTRYEMQPSKRLVPLPPVSRGNETSDPFKKLLWINNNNIKLGLNVLLFWKMIAAATEEFTFGKDISSGSEPDYHYLHDVRIRRRKAVGGELAKAVELSFPKAKGFLGYQKILKGFSPYNNNPKCHEELEKEFDEVNNIAWRMSSGSQTLDDISLMSEDVELPGKLGSMTKDLMRILADPKGIRNTQLMTQISQLQEVTLAIASGVRKCRAVPGAKGSADVNQKTTNIVLSVETMADQNAVVVNNLGPLDQREIKDVLYIVTGDFLPTHNYTYPTAHGSSRMLSMSHAQMDWNCTLTHKALSWASMIYEDNAATLVKGTELKLPRLPLWLMFVNSNKFSQAAEQVRYLVVNGISLSTGPEELLAKFDWYTPSHNIEQLYMLRMIRLMHVLSAAKCVDGTQSLRVVAKSDVSGPERDNNRISLAEWNLAMPDEDRASLNEQSLFNSFYVCKALTIQRYNKLTSEALVLLKQLEARDKYLSLRALDLPHEGRNLDFGDGTSFYHVFMRNIDNIKGAQPFSPSPLVTALGAIATCRKMREECDLTVGSTLDRVYNLKTCAWQMNLSEVMNSRGSVLSKGDNGVSVTAFVERDGKKAKSTQNAKCFETILIALKDMFDGKLPPKTMDWTQLKAVTVEMEKTVDYSGLSKMMDKLWPLVYYFACNMSACVSKMVHKDQIGSREIAVLNAAARVMCRFTEMYARHIRDAEHNKGVKTNLIERKDKQDTILRALNNSNLQRRAGRKVMYDSADCSKWGPSIMMHTLYLSVGLRVGEKTHRDILRNCYSLFGNKVFKIPDEFYLHGGEYRSEGDIRNKVHNMLVNMRKEVGSYENQIIYLEESMHQGICGVASSVMGTDAQHLSNYVTDYLLKDHNLKTVSYITSDDYSRVLSWETEQSGVFMVGKRSLSYHYNVLLHSGIRRNLQKSGLSWSYWEFNSEFMCPTGEIRPDIKSRLSYIDFSSQCDPYDISFKALSTSCEFLRSEGSFVGACWTFVLNNHLALCQNQGRQLWKTIGKGIYRVPLELGGLIEPNPLKGVCSGIYLPLLKNYGKTGDELVDDPDETMAYIMNNSPSKPCLIKLDDRPDSIGIPSFSRSSVVSLARRAPRHTRQIREYLMSLDPREFIDAVNNRSRGNLVLALLACARREAVQGWNDGPLMNYSMSQVNHDSKTFRCVESNLNLQEGIYSRRDLHRAACDFLINRHGDVVCEVEPLLSASSWIDSWKQLLVVAESIVPTGLSIAPRHVRKLRFRENYAPIGFIDEKMQEFEANFKPTCVGGKSDLHPWHYLESKIMFSQRLTKFSKRHQDFRVALRDADEAYPHLIQKLLTSNMAGGCRLDFFMARSVLKARLPSVTLDVALGLPDTLRTKPQGYLGDLLSDNVQALSSRNLLRAVDLTNFSNALIGADDRLVYNHNQVQQMIMKLKMWSKDNLTDMVVRPGQLALTFPTKVFRTTSGYEMIQKPLLSATGASGRHIQYNHAKGKWMHDFVHLRTLAPVREQSEVDIVRELDLTENDEVSVKIVGLKGFTALVEKHTLTILQIFSQLDLEVTKVMICTNSALQGNVDEIRKHNLSSYVGTTSVSHNDLVDAALGFRIERQEEEIEEAPKALNVNDMDDWGDLGSEYESEEDLLSDDDMMEGNEVSVEPMDWMADNVGDGNIKEEDVMSLDDDSSLLSGERAMSDGGFTRPSAQQYEDLKNTSLRPLGWQSINMARRELRTPVSDVYELTLPFDPGADVFYDSMSGSAVDNLLRALDKLPEGEREWCKDYVLYSIANFAPVKAAIKSLEERENEEETGVISQVWGRRRVFS